MTVRIIVGPPCAGKSSHVADVKLADEIQVDFDLLAAALGSEQRHLATGVIRSCAHEAREAAINWILANEAPAYIVDSKPSEERIATYVEHGCEFYLLDPGKEECLARCDSDERPAETKEVIENWYENPPLLPDNTVEILQVTNEQQPFPQRERLERFANMLQKIG